MNFIIDLKVYPFEIMVHFGNKKSLLSELGKYLLPNELNSIEKEYLQYKSIMFKNGQTLLYMYRKPMSIDEISILQHEITHCVIFIFR